jgi:uncharacterized membrane protein
MTRDRTTPPAVVTAGALALTGLLTVTPLSWTPLRLLMTLPVLFFLPGWVLVRTVHRPAELEGVERGLLVMGLSVVSLICLGLILDLIGPGLTAGAWVVGLAALLLPLEAVATWRDRPRTAANGRLATRPRPAAWRPPPITLAVIGACVILATGAIAWVGRAARDQVYPAFTQLWLVPSQGATGRYDIGVHSVERTRANFALVLSRGHRVLATYRYDGLPPGQTWRLQWSDTTMTGSSGLEPVQVRLLRDGRPYRLVALSSPCPLPNSEGVCTPAAVRAARTAALRAQRRRGVRKAARGA